jgi:hypothetical protein
MIKVITSLKAIKSIQNNAKKNIGLINSKPIPMDNGYEVIVLESWSLFDEKTYYTFINFLDLNGDLKYWVLTDNIISTCYNEADISEIKKDPKNSYHWPLFLCDTKEPFSGFSSLQKEFLFWSRNLILFSDKQNWIMYNNSSWDLMFIWYDPNLKQIIDLLYADHEDRIQRLNHMLEFMELDSITYDKGLNANEVKHVFSKYFPRKNTN